MITGAIKSRHSLEASWVFIHDSRLQSVQTAVGVASLAAL